MKNVQMLMSVLVLFAVTACAPVYYDAAYYDYVEPVYPYASYRHEQRHGSIEVTLFADHTYLGLNYQPVHIVVHDGDYVEVPLRNKRGHLKKVFAHYHKGDLHFDANRSCRNVTGTSRFKYDKRWEKGHRYDYISAGPDYDLRGYKLSVRKHKAESRAKRNDLGRYVSPRAKNGQPHIKPERIVKHAPKIKRRPAKVLPEVVSVPREKVRNKPAARVGHTVKRVAPKKALTKNEAMADKPKKNFDKLKKRASSRQNDKGLKANKGKHLVVNEDSHLVVKGKTVKKSQDRKIVRNKQGKKSAGHKEKKLANVKTLRRTPGKNNLQTVPSDEVVVEPEIERNHPGRKMIKRNKADG